MNPTSNRSAIPEHPKYSPEVVRRALAPKWERLKCLPHVGLVTQVACGARMARDSIHELMNMSAHIEGVMDPSEDPDDAITWEDLDYEMAAWLWTLDRAIDFLHDNFTSDVEEAWFDAGAMTAGEEAKYRAEHEKEWLAQIDAAAAQDEEPADAPHVASELPRAQSRPYWLGEEVQS